MEESKEKLREADNNSSSDEDEREDKVQRATDPERIKELAKMKAKAEERRKKRKSTKETEAAPAGDDETPAKEEDKAAPTNEEEKDTAQQDAAPSATDKPMTAPGLSSLLTQQAFNDLVLSDPTKANIEKMGFKYMTEVQARTIPLLLEGKDILGAAKTGSGKTLAFLLPVIEVLYRMKFKPRNGTGAIIITPTRELALQINNVLADLMTGHSQTYGVIMGGANRRAEAERLNRGLNIIIATPGRLLDHLQNTEGFVYKHLQCLVVDEADRILQIGFEEEMRQILKLIPNKRQTMLFSATQTQNVKDLAKLSLARPVYVGVHDGNDNATVEGLEQGYVVCPSELRFLLLFTFLRKNQDKKMIVFFSSCNSVKFHAELLNYIDIPVLDLHGNQKQQKRTTTFFDFCKREKGILCCTDVAARGLDIPAVDWIIQYDPPDDPKEYIHRVGRTARAGGKGKALLFLLPEELGFLNYLRRSKIPLNEFEFPKNKLANVQQQLEALVQSNYYLNKSAKEAYRSYLLSYASHQLKDIFNVFTLDVLRVSKSFGFTVPPRVNLNVSAIGQKAAKKILGATAGANAGVEATEENAEETKEEEAKVEGDEQVEEKAEEEQTQTNVIKGTRKREKEPRGTGLGYAGKRGKRDKYVRN